MRALLLTAGLGTRLRPLTSVRAKAAVPVNGEPLARRILRWLSRAGIHDVVLNLHHRPETITAVVGDGADLGMRVRYSWEHPVLGSAGGPRRALPLLVDGSSDPRALFLMVNGDTLTNLDLDAMMQAHQRAGAAVTMALIPNPAPEKYGGVQIADGFVTAFTRRGAVRDTFHFIGVQITEAQIFAGLPDGIPSESVGELYPRLLAREPRSIAAFVCNARFDDIGTPDDYLRTSRALASAEGDRLVSPRADIDRSAQVTGSAVWDDVVVGPDARLESCIVCDGVRIPAGARFERCAIVPAAGRESQDDEGVEGSLLVRRF